MSANLEFSQVGHEAVVNTSAHSGAYFGLTVMADAVVSAITYATDYEATGDLSDFTSLPAGVTVLCRFTSITLTSGEVLLHKK